MASELLNKVPLFPVFSFCRIATSGHLTHTGTVPHPVLWWIGKHEMTLLVQPYWKKFIWNRLLVSPKKAEQITWMKVQEISKNNIESKNFEEIWKLLDSKFQALGDHLTNYLQGISFRRPLGQLQDHVVAARLRLYMLSSICRKRRSKGRSDSPWTTTQAQTAWSWTSQAAA